MVPVLALMAVVPLARWKNAEFKEIGGKLVVPAIAAILAGGLVPWLLGGWTLLTGAGMTLAAWLAASTVQQAVKRLKAGVPPVSFWGMHLGHLGVAVFVVGVTLVGGYQEEKDVRMEPGETTTVGGHEFKFMGARNVDGPNYSAMRGEFQVSKNGRPLRALFPEKRTYRSSSMPMTEAAIDPGFTRDVYVSMGEPLEGRAWAVRVYYKPFVNWIWGGCLLMALGGLLAISDRRYRLRVKPAAAATPGMQGATT
jgi:cytochrome c-type biogenesis protein CcmF